MGQSDVPALEIPTPERYRVPVAGARTIYSSPLRRARTSVDVLFPGESAIVDVRLCERSVGEWEGLDHATVRRRWPEAFKDGTIDPLITPPGGESMKELQDRVADFLVTVTDMEEDVFVVTHNGWIRTAMLLNRDITLENLFAEAVPFLEPMAFDFEPDRLGQSRPFDDA